MLNLLKQAGEQVVDLEGIANHKGSAFGSLGNEAQPSSEHFEHLLFDELRQFDKNKVIWLEDESRNIGKDFIPQGFWDFMRMSPVVRIDCPYQVRLDRIMRDYACFDAQELEVSIKKIEKRLGYDRCKVACEACQQGEILIAAKICLAYYDRLYNDSLSKRFLEDQENQEMAKSKRIYNLSLSSINTECALPELLNYSKKIKNE